MLGEASWNKQSHPALICWSEASANLAFLVEVLSTAVPIEPVRPMTHCACRLTNAVNKDMASLNVKKGQDWATENHVKVLCVMAYGLSTSAVMAENLDINLFQAAASVAPRFDSFAAYEPQSTLHSAARIIWPTWCSNVMPVASNPPTKPGLWWFNFLDNWTYGHGSKPWYPSEHQNRW